MSRSIKIRTFAKVNLYLDVLGRRADGYHDILSVMQSVTLSDELLVEEAESGIEIVCDVPGVPVGGGNLVAHAWRLFRNQAGRPRGLRVTIEKRIPVAAGLGGGSANAAGVLTALERMYGDGGDLPDLAGQIGSDVPFFLEGGTQLAEGRGTRLEPLPSLPRCWIVLACPEIRISTKWAYSRLKMPLTREQDSFTMIRSGLGHGDFFTVACGLFNRFESVVFATYPELGSLKAEILHRRASGVVLSGSGPTLLAMVDTLDAAGSLCEWLCGRGYRSWITEPAREGTEIL